MTNMGSIIYFKSNQHSVHHPAAVNTDLRPKSRAKHSPNKFLLLLE